MAEFNDVITLKYTNLPIIITTSRSGAERLDVRRIPQSYACGRRSHRRSHVLDTRLWLGPVGSGQRIRHSICLRTRSQICGQNPRTDVDAIFRDPHTSGTWDRLRSTARPASVCSTTAVPQSPYCPLSEAETWSPGAAVLASMHRCYW